MDRTGLIDNFIVHTHIVWESRLSVLESNEHKSLEKYLHDHLNLLKDIGRSEDIVVLLDAESVSLSLELHNHANSSEERNSINQALAQLLEARKALAVVKAPESYQAVAEALSGKRKENGLPLDAFREFLKSHTTRLTNRLAAPLSVPEKNILRQRKENLQVVKELYMELQRKALGLPSKTREQGLGL